MKELEKTKRISISAVLFLLIVAIGILTFKKPEYVFQKNTETLLHQIANNNNSYIITLDELQSNEAQQGQLIDVRSNFDYSKGHFKNAINIPTHELLKKDNLELLNSLKKGEKKVILYGKDPDQANTAWMLLYQLGYENANILCAKTNYSNNTFKVENYPLEKPSVNYAEILQSSKKETEKNNTPKTPKKVFTKPKKKKRVPEGGC